MAELNFKPSNLKANSIINRASSQIQQRGRRYFNDGWRISLDKFEGNHAELTVTGSNQENYDVYFSLSANGAVDYGCSCPHFTGSRGYVRFVCKHIIAAVCFFEKYLKTNVSDWRDQVKSILEASGYENKQARQKDALLLLSFQKYNHRFRLYPYVLDAELLSDEAWYNSELAADIINKENLIPNLTAMRNSWSFRPHNFLNAPNSINPLLKGLIKLNENHYYSQDLELDYYLPQFANILTFRGTENHPCKIPVRILEKAAQFDFEINRGEEFVELKPRIYLEDEQKTIRLSEQFEFIKDKPLWVMYERKVFEINGKMEVLNSLQNSPQLKIPVAVEQEFYESFFPQMLNKFSFSGIDGEFEELHDVFPTPRLYLEEKGEKLIANLKFAYQDFEVTGSKNPPEETVRRNLDNGKFVKIRREVRIETEIESQVSDAKTGLKRIPYQNSGYELRANYNPITFLLKGIPQLLQLGFEIYGEEDLKNHKINRHKPTISFGITSGIDWFDVKANINFGEIAVSLAEVRKALKKKDKFIKLADGSLGEIPAEFLEKYKHLFGLAEEKDENLRLSHHHIALLDQLLTEQDTVKFDEKFKEQREKLKGFKEIESQNLPKNLKGELRPYQKSGFDWLHFLRDYKFGGCLADDMGIGKTFQTLAFLQSLKERKLAKSASLLVLPRSLVFNWQREIEKFTPKIKYLDFSLADRGEDVQQFDKYDLIITTYGILIRDIKKLRDYEFEYAILDEAQAIKNPVSESGKASRLIKSKHRLTLTGTPVENNTLELWSQFAFLNPGLLGSLDYFRQGFALPIEKQKDENSAELLRKLVYPFILRRTKDQVATDLPPRTERIIYCEMTDEQQKFYTQKKDYYRAKLLELIETEGFEKSRMAVLEGLLRLRQICNHPKLVETSYKGGSGKLEQIAGILETLKVEKHKALIFSQFVQTLSILKKDLEKEKTVFSYLDGKTKNRQQIVDEFQNNEDISFFLISLKAGGVGLNLTAADYVLHVDPWWNPAVEMQATDRTHRIGQDKPVFVYKFITRNTVEEKILQLQEKKRLLVSQLISTENAFFKNLSADDIKSLFT